MLFEKKQPRIILLLIVVCSMHSLKGSGQFNWLRPYDTLLVPDQYVCQGLQLTGYAEFGVKQAQGYDLAGNPVNVLQTWNNTQDALAMLNGFDPSSPIGQLNMLIDATDDGIRGHFNVYGKLNVDWAFAFAARYFFWEHLCLSFYMPFFRLQLKDVAWLNQTLNVTPDDMRVQEFLTDEFAANVCTLGQGLNICGWKREGPGDAAIFVEFFNEYPQKRPLLKNVGLHGRVGFNLPTGKRQDESLIYAVPFGYDGAAGIIGGAGFDILFADIMEFGLDVELLHLFGNIRERRIKTDVSQTELLLLAKVRAYKDWGLLQRFNLYGRVLNLFGPFSTLVGYQFFKQDESQLAFSSCEFSANIANTAKSLEEWTMHHIYTVATYDFSYYCKNEKWYNPYLSVYARIPVYGRNIALAPMVGVVFACSF